MSRLGEPYIAILLILVGILTLSSISHSYSTETECSKFPGVWSGKKVYQGGHVSHWVSRSQPDGRYFLDVMNGDGSVDYRLQGRWVCDPFTQTLQTETTDMLGQQQVDRYKLITLNDDKLVFQHMKETGPGLVFKSWRVLQPQDF